VDAGGGAVALGVVVPIGLLVGLGVEVVGMGACRISSVVVVAAAVRAATVVGVGTSAVPVAWELADRDRALLVVDTVDARFVVLAEADVLAPNPSSDRAVVRPADWDGPGFEIGCATLVDKYMMSLPWTTRLSLDFFSSNVSISSDKISISVMNEVDAARTVASEPQIQHIANSHIYNAQESLVLPLELALVEYLDSDDRGILDSTTSV